MRVQPGCGLSQTLRHKKLQFWREIADSADLSATIHEIPSKG
jgi:hypothetical protein